MEHHANIVPWHFLRERQGVVLKWVDIEADGVARPAEGARRDRAADEAGRGDPYVERARHGRRHEGDLRRRAGAGRAGAGRRQPGGGAPAGRCAATSAAISMSITGHKLYGPTGSGALYARRERLAEMRPVPRRRRHDPRGAPGRDHLRRPAAEVRGGDAGDRADDRPRRGARLHEGLGVDEHRRPRARACATMPARGSRGSTG